MKSKLLTTFCAIVIVSFAGLDDASGSSKHQAMRLDVGVEHTITLEPQERFLAWLEKGYCMYSPTQRIDNELKNMRNVRFNNQRHVSQLYPRLKLQDNPYAPIEATMVIIKHPAPTGAEILEFTLVKLARGDARC